MADAKKSGDFDNLEICRKKLLKSAITLADWLSSHPLVEPEKEESESYDGTEMDDSS